MRKTLALLAVAFVSLSCRDPRAEANIAQAMMDVGSAIAEINQNIGELHNTVDSLRNVVTRQDSTIVKLANLAGVPLPPRY